MIENDQQLEATLEVLGSAYLALAEVKRDPQKTQPYGPAAQPLLCQISKMRADLDTYLGLGQVETADEPPPFVIENDEQLRGTHQALSHLYKALAALRKDLPQTSHNYTLYARGNLDEIFKLQSEIDAYLGLAHAAAEPLVLRESPPGNS